MAASSSKMTCYGSYGSNYAVVAGALPCNPQAQVSTCCGFTETCFSNGLCAPGPGLPNWGPNPYYTGYCTDPSWSNGTACPSICNNQLSADIGGNGLQLCGSNGYCCYNYSLADCCQTSSLVFFLAAITSSTVLPSSSPSVATTTSSFSTSTDATPTTSSFSTLIDTTTTTSSFSTTIDATTTTSSSLVSSTPTLPTILPAISPSTNSSTSHTPTNHFAAGVGAGIGIAAALLFLVGLTFIMRQWRTRNRAPQTHGNLAHGEKLGIIGVRTLRRRYEMDGQKPILVEPDGRNIVEIDNTRGNTWF